jgi:single-strand DNA-binding protein
VSSVNKAILLGHLGADPELRTTQSGQPVASLRIATSETWNDKDGQRQERTEWHQVTVWGKQAEHCSQYLRKGREVFVEGRLQSREYTDKDGVQRRVWEVVADRVVFVGGGGERAQDGAGGAQPRAAGAGGSSNGGAPRGASQGGGKRAPAVGTGRADLDDDPIPF